MEDFQSDSKYQDYTLFGQVHPIFRTIASMISTYKEISEEAFEHRGQYRVRDHGVDCWFLDSIAGTLESIQLCLSKGHLADSYGLLRSIIERTYIHIYLLIAHDESDLPTEVDQSSIASFISSVVSLQKQGKWTDKELERWIIGKRDPLPKLNVIKDLVNSYSSTYEFKDLFCKKVEFQISNRANAYLHAKSASFLRGHFDWFNADDLKRECDQLLEDLRFVVVKHIAYLFVLRTHYMIARDYKDAIDDEGQPDQDAANRTAPNIQRFLLTESTLVNPNIALVLKRLTQMNLDDCNDHPPES